MSLGAAMPPTAPTSPTQPPAVPKRKRRGCVAQGCLTLLGLLFVMTLIVGALLLRVPQQLGLWNSGARLLDGTPDRAAAATIVAQLEKAGVDTTGLSVYVLPVRGQDGALAYAVLDTSAGFAFPTDGSANPLVDLFGNLAAGPTVQAAHITQVAIEYRDASGQVLGVLTATSNAIRQFTSGQIDEQGFSAQLHGDIQPAAIQAARAP